MNFGAWAREAIKLQERHSAENWALWTQPAGLVTIVVILLAAILYFVGWSTEWSLARSIVSWIIRIFRGETR